MIDGLKPYPKLKDSRVPWLGEMPEHWEVRRIGSVADMRVSNVDKHMKETELPVRLCNYVDVYRNGRITDRIPFMQATATPEEIERFGVQIGDVLITKDSETWNDIGVPSLVEYAPADLVCGYHLAIFRPCSDLAIGAYLHRALQSPGVAYQFHIAANGVTRYGLSHNSIGSVQIPLPPLFEQDAMVRFLDHADRRIRHYISAKQKLIKLLEEHKQVIINCAVTRGLDPDARLKPSGVEWLGTIPEHWQVVLNQRIFKEIIRPHEGKAETQLSLSQRDGLIATADMNERSLQTSSYDNWKVTMPGDLVLNRFKAHLGVFFASTLRGIVSFHYGVFAPRKNNVMKYFQLLYHTNAYRAIYAGLSNGMTVGLQNLSNQHFYSTKSIVPPASEQIEIVAFAEKVAHRTNLVVESLQRECALLREYRTRLISDVVTGKLDVREAATHLPDEVGDTEPLEEADTSIDPADETSDDAAPEEVEE